ncbi:MAG: phenylalanine--tRNA ligase subunit beta [Verrucomicrobia bacterium]|jgi:phenylalanyl-tRNA synthetase beta chain|nr:phenylalanine--tRNA ligase subunit beta [Verrucomicrobiota bacterium]OQC27323.1 MAG: Phenylalanine--tRNA ligase beta subunit [Verrucomicrobia bacterium ADurb.Bin063]HNW06146.1 phenylalanine--tRNA ligase subunit beta [Verrucomicrobiota bacterium]HOC50420.1 phenylalanine--tRNA ligase subunit beta [Verrucomicrobiota bacterium]HPW90806.1 phenylalanine--tRNA ligase subunit beta [Verrucomicrobiota bacterium]
MKVTFNWLKQYVEFDWSPAELAERLTMLGLEVENVQKLEGEFEGVVVAQVVTKDKHPNADKLNVCRVNDGQGERQIVCGAQNFKAGDKVPLILPGFSLPAKPGEAPLLIKVGKIRGVESLGMMCAPQELGLGDEVSGLLILREDARVGQPFSEYLGRSGTDMVYDLEITPNRPDLNSVIGIAREISAVTGNPLRLPEVNLTEASGRVADAVAVRIEDAELCPRYTARVIRGVKVAASPDWLRHALEKVGVRSINNVVDVTNYVMLETGQPLHAFDYHLLAKSAANGLPTIVIRPAAEGEKFITLDGQERALTRQMLLIADETKAVALAGVMGGQNSEINPNTVDVLIESACFKPQNIRATSRKLDLRTESSYRYERGADIGICDWASQRAAQLILATAGGKLAQGLVDAWPQPFAPRQITLRHAQCDAVLGVAIPAAQQTQFLQRLALKVEAGPAGEPPATTFGVPSFRVDLKREIDLIEEVARLYGVDKIPATPPRGAVGAHPHDAVHDQLANVRRILTGLGLYEAQGQTLVSDVVARLTHGSALVPLSNPLSSDMNVLRPSLLPGLLAALRHNVSRKINDLALFEVGRVFLESEGQRREERRVALALTGQRHPLFWSGEEREARFDISDLKGLLEEFLEQFGVRGMNYVRRPESTALFLESATVHLGRFQLGEFGLLLPSLARQHDLRDAVLLAELNLDLLLARRNPNKSFRPLPAFPAIRRDIAMILPAATTHESILQVIKQAKPANLEAVELFDVFRGKNVPAGQKSMAYAFTYRHADRTLTDAEVNAVHDKLVVHLKQRLQATVRE